MGSQRPPANPPTMNKTPRRRAGIVLGLVVVLVAYALSGFYFVQPDQRGVVRWFGRVPAGQQRPPFGVAPGLHYAAPWPFCKVDVPRTTEVRSTFVGMPPALREAIAAGDTEAMRVSPATDVFSGDVNILKVTMAVHYKVGNSVAYLFGTEDPDALVRATVLGVLIEELASLPVDQALTAAKAKLEIDTQARAQELLDSYGCGLQLVATNLETIEPPRAIAAAFKDVVSAKKDGERVIDRAVAEKNRILPTARGDASRLEEEAEAYYQTRVAAARADADVFVNLLREYQLAPGVTRDRLRLQTFEKTLARVRKIIVDNKPGEPPTRIRIIDKDPE